MMCFAPVERDTPGDGQTGVVSPCDRVFSYLNSTLSSSAGNLIDPDRHTTGC